MDSIKTFVDPILFHKALGENKYGIWRGCYLLWLKSNPTTTHRCSLWTFERKKEKKTVILCSFKLSQVPTPDIRPVMLILDGTYWVAAAIVPLSVVQVHSVLATNARKWEVKLV